MKHSLRIRLIISSLYFILAVFGCKKHEMANAQTPSSPGNPVADSLSFIPDINAEDFIDQRSITLGNIIYKAPYLDQPYIVQARDSSWICVFTTGRGAEGTPGQHVMSSRSTDLGKTWGPAVDIEPSSGPVASWAIPYITAYGRIYVFYDYNGDNISELNGKHIKNDLLGWYCYKYSDDMGQTWSDRYRLSIKNTLVDNNNNFKGQVQMFWGICKPIHSTNGLLFSYTKIGAYISDRGEGWLVNCPNIETEKDINALQWNILPGGDVGIKNPTWSLQEEHNLVQLSNGSLYCVNRTYLGFPGFAISTNLGTSWNTPAPMRYGNGTPSDRIFKHPTACPRIFKCSNGKYLFWFHNYGTPGYNNRNPVWVSGGIERNGTIWWSEPEILLYSGNVNEGMSYPDLIEQEGKYFITETQKNTARVHEISPLLLNDLWYQRFRKEKVTRGLINEYEAPNDLTLPSNNKFFPSLENNGGFTVDFFVTLNNLNSVGHILTNSTGNGPGLDIATTNNGTIAISLNDGVKSVSLETDKGTIVPNKLHHVAFVVDGGANIIMAMVDGKLCDGGANAPAGWTRFFGINNINTDSPVTFGKNLDGTISNLKIYSRALRTSELVSNYRAAK
ncbi:sialidase family protein [Mucilaginibacter rubeus]|uniref:Sialidase domain-containing protein n=1 Tax=Mucilaginibacter rubeus TaxID=2027860 RepID=A0A5C1I2E5_9SPHI|nr:sialidase family protein [Mucilaginibacter rubeus]QEM12039.1 hypothetical protein DEO27_019060 [Mucilaginibacter rubeus]